MLRPFKRNKVAVVIITYLFFSPLFSYAQKNDFISGKLLDIYSNEPINRACVKILSDSVYSDRNGNFSYYFKNDIRKISLQIQHPSYTSEFIRNWNVDSILLLKMIPKKQLENVVVTFGARSLIDSLRANIGNNNLLAAYSLDGFYRTYQIVDDTIFFVSERCLVKNVYYESKK